MESEHCNESWQAFSLVFDMNQKDFSVKTQEIFEW